MLLLRLPPVDVQLLLLLPEEAMTRICHAHCPDEGASILGAIAAGVIVLGCYAAAEVIESMLLAMFTTATVALAAATYVTVRVLRSHRGTSYAMYEPGRVISVPSVMVQAAPHELGVPRRAIPPARTVLQAAPEPSPATAHQ